MRSLTFTFTFTFTVALALFASLAQAQAPIESLSKCLADNTSGRDRKDLARWVFFAMAAHPEIKKYSSPDLAADSDEVDKTMAGTFTRLLADSCPAETQAAFKQGGAKAIEVAFQTLGRLAMKELMSDQDVIANMSKFEKLFDQNKLTKVLTGN